MDLEDWHVRDVCRSWKAVCLTKASLFTNDAGRLRLPRLLHGVAANNIKHTVFIIQALICWSDRVCRREKSFFVSCSICCPKTPGKLMFLSVAAFFPH